MKTVIVRGAALTAQPFAPQPRRPPPHPRARPPPARRSSRGCRPGRAAPRRRSRAATRPAARARSSPIATSAARRSAASRTTPPLPTRSRPTSNCGLTSARQSKRGAAAARTAGSTLARPMNETSIAIRSGTHGSASGDERARVAALDHGHARILAQPPVQLAVGDVERHHRLGPTLKQAVGEPAGGGAHVEAAPAGRIDREGVERVGELDPAARHERRRGPHRQLRVLGDQLPGLGRRALVDAHVPGQHRGRGTRAGVVQPALRQQGVEAALRHARSVLGS